MIKSELKDLSMFVTSSFCGKDLGGKFSKNTETDKCSFFELDNLPPLSLPRNSLAEIKMCFEANQSPNWQTKFE